MSIKDLTQKSFSVLIIRSFGVLLLFGLTMFLTNFYSAENVGRYDFVRSTIMVLGGLTLMGTNQSIIYYSGLLKARKSIESIRTIYFKMLRIIFFLSLIFLRLQPLRQIDNKPFSGYLRVLQRRGLRNRFWRPDAQVSYVRGGILN